MEYRIAKRSDSKILAQIHFTCSKNQVDGFMHRLGVRFLTQYYRIFLSEKYSLIVIAEEDGRAIGFHSGTLKSEEHQKALKDKKFLLGIYSVFAIVSDMKLMYQVIKRFKSLGTKEDDYRVKSGPRGEYWAWLPEYRNPGESLNLHRKWHEILKTLGAEFVRSEVDLSNKRVVKSIEIMGGTILKRIELEDGRKRAIVEYKL